MPWTEGERPLDPSETQELFEAIREASLDESENALRSLGIPEADIKKARAECIATDSDKPFQDLMASNPTYLDLRKKMFGV